MAELPIALLRTFVVVAETLNLSAAASRLHRAPSTVSMQLNRLEARVDTTLLERGQYGVRLTPEGESLKLHAHQLLSLHDRIVGTFKHADVGGSVRFSTHDQYATRLLPSILEAFVLAYPQARLEVVSDHRPDYLLELMDKKQLDVALVEMPRLSEGAVRLSQDQLVWVQSDRLTIHDKELLPLATFPPGCYHRSSALKALEQAGRSYHIAFTSQSRAGVLAAVRAGVGVGVVPRSMVEEGMVIVDSQLPALPETNNALFVQPHTNEASARLAQTIEHSPQFQQ